VWGYAKLKPQNQATDSAKEVGITECIDLCSSFSHSKSGKTIATSEVKSRSWFFQHGKRGQDQGKQGIYPG
jgi:hypothetical protein